MLEILVTDDFLRHENSDCIQAIGLSSANFNTKEGGSLVCALWQLQYRRCHRLLAQDVIKTRTFLFTALSYKS